MATSTVMRVGGVVIVTQVIPQSEQNAVALTDTPTETEAPPTYTSEAPPTYAQEAPPAGVQEAPPACVQEAPPTYTEEAPSPVPEPKDAMTTMFLRGEPVIMGVFQLFLGLVCVLFSLTAAFHRILLLHAPICGSVLCVAAGAVTLSAAKVTTPLSVRLTACWSVLSSVLSAGGVAYLSWLLAGPRPTQRLCEGLVYNDCVNFNYGLWGLDTLVMGLQGLFLFLMILQLTFSLVVSSFSIKAAKQRPLQVSLLEADSDESLLQADGP